MKLEVFELTENRKYWRKKQVTREVGVTYSTIWRWEQLGLFPKRRQLGPGTVAWVADEVIDWLENRPVVE